jgi:hypothetical protein
LVLPSDWQQTYSLFFWGEKFFLKLQELNSKFALGKIGRVLEKPVFPG